MTDQTIERKASTSSEERLREAKLLCRFFPGLSAYLRSALSGITLSAENLAPEEARDFNAELDQNASVLEQGCYRLLRLATNLSTLANLEMDPLPPVEDRDIVAEASQVCLEAEYPAELLGLTLHFRCQAGGHLCALRQGAVRQMLHQLLSNAFRFTPAGGKVTVSLEIESGWIQLMVEDTGVGMSEERKEHCFDRFLDIRPEEMPPQGMGLGLSICRRLAQLHGGRMALESREGAGTRVIVMLEDRKLGNPAVEDHRMDYEGGFNSTLLGLADALPARAFRKL